MEIVDSIWFSQTTGSKSNHNYCLKLSPQKKAHYFRSMVLDSFRGMQCADNFVITTNAHCKNFRDDFKMVIAMITKLTMIWDHLTVMILAALIYISTDQPITCYQVKDSTCSLSDLGGYIYVKGKVCLAKPFHIPQKKSYLWCPVLQRRGRWWFGCIYLQLYEKNKKQFCKAGDASGFIYVTTNAWVQPISRNPSYSHLRNQLELKENLVLKSTKVYILQLFVYDDACSSCQAVVRRNYEEQNFFEGSHVPLNTYCHASSY